MSLYNRELTYSNVRYWKEKLMAVTPLLVLPLDKPRSTSKINQNTYEQLILTKDFSQQFIDLSKQNNISLYIALAASLKILLYRYSGQKDIVIGSLAKTASDNLVETPSNTLPLRTYISPKDTFLELLEKVKQTCLEAVSHSELPFNKLVEMLNIERNLSYCPVFQVLLTLEEDLLNSSSLPESKLGNLDLIFAFTKQDQVLTLKLEYNTDLFESSTISRLIGNYKQLLESIVENPNKSIGFLQLLSQTEISLLDGFNQKTERFYPDHYQTMHQMFEAKVALEPQATALIFENKELSYQELNNQANRFAHYLRSLGVGPEVLVGIALKRSVEMIVAMMAILKAGGGYIPLDVNYPKERLALMLADSKAKILITQAGLNEELNYHGHVVYVDSELENISKCPETNPISGVSSRNIAYIIYTSGSTGVPKGVAIEHHSVITLFHWSKEIYSPESLKLVLASTSICFDISVFEIFVTLALGGAILLTENALQLPKLKHANQVTLINTVPSAIAELIKASSIPDSTFIINLAGEPLQKSIVDQLFEKNTVKEIYNLYGPSEDTTYSTYAIMERGSKKPVNIGIPVSNTQVYIVDENFQRVPVGVVGEIYIGGKGLSRGYFDKPALTAERFIPNPFSTIPSERIYKTGDIGKYLPTGEIDYLGRIDNQVKIRGYRIELGEIEATLLKHPAVKEALVVVQEVSPSDKNLVAYLIAKEHSISNQELRQFLRQQLPRYMVPSAFGWLDAFPLTANGKINRNALPKITNTSQVEENFLAPRNPIEQTLANLWTTVLKLDKVGINDTFFEIGGHSLLAFQLAFHIQRSFNIDLSVINIFETPTIAALAEKINGLTKETQSTIASPIVAVERKESHPLSFAQQRLWFLAQFEPNNPFYNIVTALEVAGRLSPEALEKSVNKVIECHEVLRTRFITISGQPVQVIAPNLKITLEVIDLTDVPSNEKKQRTLELAKEESLKVFALDRLPLLKLILIKQSEIESTLLLNIHHIISDGWSVDVFWGDFWKYYQEFVQGKQASPEALPIQYLDYTLWQLDNLKGEALEKEFGYWKEKLKGIKPLLTFPTDRPRPAIQTFNGEHHRFRFSEQLIQDLKLLSRKHNVTLFITLLSAFKVLFYRYSGETEIIVGSPSAGRSKAESSDLIGFFVNTLLFRTSLSSKDSFLESLEKVRQTCLEAQLYQEFPFEKLVELLQPERNLSHSTLFQAMFVQNIQQVLSDLPGLRFNFVPVETATAKFDLTVSITEIGEEFLAGFNYNTDLYDKVTIERIAKHYQTLLQAIVENPTTTISTLPLLTEVERQEIVFSFNQTYFAIDENKCFHQLFEDQVKLTPNARAVIFYDRELSYQELNSKANQLAHYLISLGVKAEALVGIYTEPCLEMMIALLAVLKAGGAYLPLEPSYPAERIRFMIEDSSVRIILTQEALAESFSDYTAKLIFIDSDLDIFTKENSNPAASVTGHNICYVMYTSGSTGRPKGVMTEHRSLVNYVCWVNRVLFQDVNILPVVTKFYFDGSIRQLFAPLLRGKYVWILSNNNVLDSKMLLELLAKQEDVALSCVPSLWKTLLDTLSYSKDNKLDGKLSTLFLGGDAVTKGLVEETFKLLPNIKIWDLYGPTEVTVNACGGQVLSENEINIGTPLANVQTYVLDNNLQPTPIGVQGELYVGGMGLARGYLNNPDLTAERFIANPFTNKAGERLYKTGDLTRYKLDGSIEFLGRADAQVKIRGYRIEIGEIETTILEHPQIKEVVVIVQSKSLNDKNLVAYLIARQETLSNQQLREFLKEKLPNYMIPAAFVWLERFPLNANGKLDLQALPVATELVELKENFLEARSPIEEILVGVWQKNLKLDVNSIYDNFFELGGHSLLAIELIFHIQRGFNVELSVRNIFESPTIDSLAQKITQVTKNAKSVTAPVIAVDKRESLPLSFAQQRLWFLAQFEPDSPAYNVVTVSELVGKVNLEALEKSINEIVKRHEVLRTRFITVSDQPVQVIESNLDIRLERLDLAIIPENERRQKALEIVDKEAVKPFILDKLPLIRSLLIKLSEENFFLFFNIHHIVSDAWSSVIFWKELSHYYQNYVLGQETPLQALSVQYGDYAFWQRKRLEGEILKKEFSYWKAKLAEVKPLTTFPTDRARPPIQSHKGSFKSFPLSKDLIEKLQSLSKKQSVTLFMSLLTAFKILFYRYSAERDIVVGSPITGRNTSEVDSLIGFFLNTLVLRTSLSPTDTYLELLEKVKQTCLEAYSYAELPFEKLVELLQPERNLSYSPIFQVMFVVYEDLLSSFSLPELKMNRFNIENNTAKFDLIFVLSQKGQELTLGVEYSTDLFEASTIHRMMLNYEQLLKSIAENPNQLISLAPILNKLEKTLLLEEFNQTTRAYNENKCVHHLFEEQAKANPNTTALIFENKDLSYEELNKRANQLAHYLQALGIKEDIVVGLCIERSLEMIVGLLAILKAGAGYVSLDPTYPRERLAFMLEDSNAMVLLTQENLTDLLPKTLAKVVCIDKEWTEISGLSKLNTNPSSSSMNLAYVIYTSGSTGRPKGVAMPHKPLYNLIDWQLGNSKASLNTRTLQFTSLSFDVSFQEIFSSLVSGGTLVLISEDSRRDPKELLNYINEKQVERLFLPFVALQNLAEAAANLDIYPTNLLEVITAGEQLKITPYIEQFFVKMPKCSLYNHYGPSETHVVTALDLETSINKWPVLPSIGKPIANTEIYILDSSLNLSPIGVVGELYIAGDSLARAYLNRPELTAERFVPNPFNNGERLYKTGDLAKWLADGNIDFLGRADNQIKIRGFRVELGEIESVLLEHPLIKDARVIFSQDSSSDRKLIAYLIAKQEVLSTKQLQEYLKDKLPNYMIPVAYVWLESFPLTPSGKLDQSKLPSIEGSKLDLEDYVQPRTPIEELIAGIWSKVLNIEKVSITDNFFVIGGHSLLATQVAFQLQRILKVDITLRMLFEYPTIAQLSAQIDLILQANLPRVPVISTTAQTQPLSASQLPLWAMHQLYPKSFIHRVEHTYHLVGELNIDALERSVNEVIKRHKVFRTNIVSIKGQPIQQINPNLTISLRFMNLEHLEGEEKQKEIKRLMLEQHGAAFNLVKEPLIRVRLLQIEKQEYLLLITLNHLIFDGWSEAIFCKDLSAIYQAFLQGKESPLVTPAVQYVDFVDWQNRLLKTEVATTQLAYWKEKLSGKLQMPILPLDHARPKVASGKGIERIEMIKDPLASAIIKFSNEIGVTVFMTMLAAFKMLLYSYSKQEDILVASHIFHRPRIEFENVIGHFVIALPLRTSLSSDPTFLEILKRVRETLLQAYNNSDVAGQKLIQEFVPKEPYFMNKLIFFIYQGYPGAGLDLGDIKVDKIRPVSAEEPLTDLTFFVSKPETEGLRLRLVYNVDLFEKATIDKMLSSYEKILNRIIKNPEEQLSVLVKN